jgi:hypothetical protein
MAFNFYKLCTEQYSTVYLVPNLYGVPGPALSNGVLNIALNLTNDQHFVIIQINGAALSQKVSKFRY